MNGAVGRQEKATPEFSIISSRWVAGKLFCPWVTVEVTSWSVIGGDASPPAARRNSFFRAAQLPIESIVDLRSQRSITDFWNRQSLPILNAGICPRFSRR